MALIKDPHSIVDYQFDWTAYCAQEGGDTITSASVAIDNPTHLGGDLAIIQTRNASTTVTVWLQNGTPNTIYQLTCTITTSGGRTDSYTALLSIQNK